MKRTTLFVALLLVLGAPLVFLRLAQDSEADAGSPAPTGAAERVRHGSSAAVLATGAAADEREPRPAAPPAPASRPATLRELLLAIADAEAAAVEAFAGQSEVTDPDLAARLEEALAPIVDDLSLIHI